MGFVVVVDNVVVDNVVVVGVLVLGPPNRFPNSPPNGGGRTVVVVVNPIKLSNGLTINMIGLSVVVVVIIPKLIKIPSNRFSSLLATLVKFFNSKESSNISPPSIELESIGRKTNPLIWINTNVV